MYARFLGALVFALGLPTSLLAQTVTLRPAPEGVRAEYHLDAKSDQLTFAEPDTVRTDWSAVTPNTALTRHGLHSDTPIDRFIVEVRPDSTEEGRGYVALTRLGDGYVLYAPALTALGGSLDLEVDLPDGWTLLPGPPFDGYVYLGPSSAVTHGATGGVHVASEAPPSNAAASLFDSFDIALGFFAERFGPLPRVPVVSITSQGAGPMPFRGDVTDSGMISIRFHGDAGELDASSRLQIQHFGFHETSHLWNSHMARPVEGSPWLHEGGAEYLALVAAVSTGHLTQTRALASLSQSLTDCRNALADRPDVLARISAGAAVYSCGSVIQWLADMELRQERGQPDGVVSIWAAFVARARDGSAEYGPEDLNSALGPTSAVAVLLEGPAETRWRDLETALARLNVRWVNRPSNLDLMTAALRHVKRQACVGGLSYFVRGGAVEMENGTNCGPLSGTVTLTAVEGHDPVASPALMFEAIQRRCGRGEPLNVTLRGVEGRVSVPCATDLASPAAYAITQAPPVGLSVMPNP